MNSVIFNDHSKTLWSLSTFFFRFSFLTNYLKQRERKYESNFFRCWKKIALSICKLNKTKKIWLKFNSSILLRLNVNSQIKKKKTNTHTQREWQLRSNLVCHSSMIHIMIRTFNSNHHQQNIMSIRLLWIFWLLFFFFSSWKNFNWLLIYWKNWMNKWMCEVYYQMYLYIDDHSFIKTVGIGYVIYIIYVP